MVDPMTRNFLSFFLVWLYSHAVRDSSIHSVLGHDHFSCDLVAQEISPRTVWDEIAKSDRDLNIVICALYEIGAMDYSKERQLRSQYKEKDKAGRKALRDFLWKTHYESY